MAALRERLVSCMVADVRDETSPAFSAGELDAMRAAHPMLGEVIDVLRAGSLPAAELAGLSRATEIPVECLDEKLFFRAQRLLLRALREVGDAT